MAAISSVVDLPLKATLAAVFETSNISAILVLSAGFSVWSMTNGFPLNFDEPWYAVIVTFVTIASSGSSILSK